jgi:hypothetical protein
MNDDIAAGSTITVTTTNLLNPESVAWVGEIVITTMMKYQTDSQYYQMDSSSQDP